MDASVTVYTLTLHAEVDARGWYPTLIGSNAAVPVSIVCCNTLDLQGEVGGEPRTRAQSNIHTTTLPGQVKTYGAGHHTGQQRCGAWWRCYIERHGDIWWRFYTQTNTQIHRESGNISACEGVSQASTQSVDFLSCSTRFSSNVWNFLRCRQVCKANLIYEEKGNCEWLVD